MVEDNQGNYPYEDIINLRRHVSSTREHMSIPDRAAQFSPFAALTGFEGAIKETARLTDKKIVLEEAEKTLLDEKLSVVQEQLSKRQEVEIVYFQSDELKSGGAYLSVRGIIKRIDKYECVVVIEDGTKIPIEDITDITGFMFQTVDYFFE